MTTIPAAVAWHRAPMLGFDLETTGTSVETDRIVTAAVVRVGNGDTRLSTWLANPGIDIPQGATDVHGITTAKARAEGQNPEAVLGYLLLELAAASAAGVPIVGMNLAYDMTLLDRELRRHGLGPLPPLCPVIDVRVLDKACDPYRKGGRKLADLVAAYGVRLDQAHDAGYDALGALRVAWAIAQRYPELQIDPVALHERQIRWHASQVASFAAYRAKQGQPLEDANGEWPVRSLPTIPSQRTPKEA